MSELPLFVLGLSMAGLLYTYIGYPLLLALVAWLRPRATGRKEPVEWPFVTILVPAHNEERVIREKLDSILRLDYPRSRLRPENLAASLGIPHEAPVVGSVGRLEPVKRFDLLLSAFARVMRRMRDAGGPDPHLVLVGDGSDRARLEDLARRLGVSERIALSGWQLDVSRYYALFDVFVLCSDSEGMPIGLLEAMASGLPAVATDVGAVAEVLTGELRDQVVAPGDSESLADKILQLLSSSERRTRIGELCRQRAASEYSLDATLRAYRELYEVRGQSKSVVSDSLPVARSALTVR